MQQHGWGTLSEAGVSVQLERRTEDRPGFHSPKWNGMLRGGVHMTDPRDRPPAELLETTAAKGAQLSNPVTVSVVPHVARLQAQGLAPALWSCQGRGGTPPAMHNDGMEACFFLATR